MLFRPGYSFITLTAAIVGGILLAQGHYVGGAILVAIAFLVAAGRYVVDRRGEDDTFTLW